MKCLCLQIDFHIDHNQYSIFFNDKLLTMPSMFIHQRYHFDSDGVNNSNLSPLLFHRDLVTKLCDDVNSLGINGIYIRCSTSTFCLFHEN